MAIDYTLEVCNLTLQSKKSGRILVDKLSFSVAPNETLAIVGESGSGKSLTALSIMGLLDDTVIQQSSGEIFFHNELLGSQHKESKRKAKILGKKISMIFQEPMTALNPSIRCGKQVDECILLHSKKAPKDRKAEILDWFQKVGLNESERIFQSYPHQLSGGQRQRVMIAMALINRPDLIIADEPTTALDASVRMGIINLLHQLVKAEKASLIFISHDLSLVENIADQVLVMRHGVAVEYKKARALFSNPENEYTQILLKCRPQNAIKGQRMYSFESSSGINSNQEVDSKPSLETAIQIENLSKWYKKSNGLFGNAYQYANRELSFSIKKGETLGIIGESGSGETTLVSSILRLHKADSGSIHILGKDWNHLSGKALRKARREVQIVFQDPYSSLNPSLKIGTMLMELLRYHKIGKNKIERKQKIESILIQCGLQSEDQNKYPHQFSGGQRQRIAIARALIIEPKILILDEPVSALDVSVQASIINLLNDLKAQFGLTYLFISHDIHLVRYFCDQVFVLKGGRCESYGSVSEVLEKPENDYVKTLLLHSGIK